MPHLSKLFASHGFTRHGKGEHVVGDVHTNTVEGFFSVFKRGMKGVYQRCKAKYRHRYVAGLICYNNRVRLGVDDSARTINTLRGIVAKRLTYRGSPKVA